jgi:hypothetical protein
MALEFKEVRALIDADTHSKLWGIAAAQERGMNELLRDAVDLFIAEEIRKAHVAIKTLRALGVHGNGAEKGGTSTP